MDTSTKPKNHENEGLSVFWKMKLKSCQSKMMQTNSTELSCRSFLELYNKNATPDFPGSSGNQLAFNWEPIGLV